MKNSVFTDGGQWYKGNMHCHTTMSDGTFTPAQRAAMYKEKGYSFLSLTDHNVFASYPEFCDEQFLMIPGTERDVNDPDYPYFCLHALGISEREIPEKVHEQLRCYGRDKVDIPWQDLIDEMRAAGQMVILAHPVWSRNTPEQFLALTDYVGIEVYNRLCEMDSHTGKADYFIDCCLRKGKKVLLFAHDDSHGWDHTDSDCFGGWIMVKAPELSCPSLLRAIQSGSFYASTGPEIYDFGMEDGKVYIDCAPCEEIHFVTYPHRGESIFRSGSTHAEFIPQEGQDYVRCEVIDSRGRVAYTNPIYLG